MLTAPHLHVCLFGASQDTGNLGVSALMTSLVSGLAKRCPAMQFTVFDNGLGQRAGQLRSGGHTVDYDLFGARVGRRYHRPENLRTMRWSARLGGLGNDGVQRVRTAHAVLDVSGGDSFTDLYGPARFNRVVLPKRLALDLGVPLVLLPQTYGPFASANRRRAARTIIGQAHIAWARDPFTHRLLQQLLAQDFDPARHRQGVDLAFTLPPSPPPATVRRRLKGWLAATDPSTAVVGLNVSGLLYGNPDAPSRYGLRVDYRQLVTDLLRRLLRDSSARVLLVPHVFGTQESDLEACVHLARQVADPRRVAVAPEGLDAQQTKWLVSQLDWFCGTRMHSTIAALSSGVPAAAIAYSAKTAGVFETCGMADQVADARTSVHLALLDQVWGSFTNRNGLHQRLQRRLPAVLTAAEEQMDDLLQTLDGLVGAPARKVG